EAGAEARELAALLVAAAEPARVPVTHDEVERALRAVRPHSRARARLVPALGLALVLLTAAVVAWVVRTPGSEVQAKAANALDATFFVVGEVRSSFLPRRIVWRQGTRLVSVTRFAALERQRRPVDPAVWTLIDHQDARAVQLTSTGERVRVLSIRASHLPRGARWLGPSYEGRRARVATVQLTGGSAVRIAYGPVVVWNYRRIVPPAVLQLRGGPAKIFPVPGGI